MLLDKIKTDYKIQIIYVLTLVFHIHVQNWNLSQNQNNSLSYIFHSGTPIFHFCLSPFGSGEIVWLGNHRIASTEGFGGSSFFLIGLPYFFICCHSNLPLYLLFLCSGWSVYRWGIMVSIYILVLLVYYSELVYRQGIVVSIHILVLVYCA